MYYPHVEVMCSPHCGVVPVAVTVGATSGKCPDCRRTIRWRTPVTEHEFWKHPDEVIPPAPWFERMRHWLSRV
jgi:hypothetical protein